MPPRTQMVSPAAAALFALERVANGLSMVPRLESLPSGAT
ncbi:hypothetical protein SCE1572_06380 [Sorangium cellulosum So0157-2]|uniref:Uncharacterized protein n=1 Tax=Sorangium cellulosum So0157-2 TaxID=1254432 RepID=S4XLV9_SORCE|nr:hypothetical protein SCE1572_06380 [Sorangium cellulosum So0157-2]